MNQSKMIFEDFPYERPDMQDFERRFLDKLARFDSAAQAELHLRLFSELNDMRTAFLSMYNICHIRHTADTRHAFYEKENDFFDQHMPAYQALTNKFYEALLRSSFRAEIENRWGQQIFVIAELSLKTLMPQVLEDLQEENRLSSEYVKLKAGARITFRGNDYNLSSIHKLELSPDRNIRREASEAKWSFFVDHSESIEQIFGHLVKTRHSIARKLGFDGFVQLGYDRLLRADYGPDQVAAFRQQILEYVVPVATELYERQRRRLGIRELYYYDEEFQFNSGNPEPKGDPEWIIGNAALMYSELSAETKAFFEFMRSRHLMDLETRPGKATGGYCTFIGKYKAPFIFSNFNGTSGDIDVLTHEAGHAFQVYASRAIGINEYQWPTLEACEIHSMSMEFFTWPWMKLFFKDETAKYHFAHLANALFFMPYGVAIDEFQHFVYENPEVDNRTRNAVWREIERRYLPHRHYAGFDFLEEGGFWQKQSHLFSTPFYYIDYVLAQVCALQFWLRSQHDREEAWNDYLRLCRAGGSMSFLELVELAGLKSPFGDGVVATVVEGARKWLDQVKDTLY